MTCTVSNAGDVAYTSLVVVIAVIECNRLKSMGQCFALTFLASPLIEFLVVVPGPWLVKLGRSLFWTWLVLCWHGDLRVI
jgi:hypothetical protein